VRAIDAAHRKKAKAANAALLGIPIWILALGPESELGHYQNLGSDALV
jgi:hypothetical protein